MKRYTFLLCVLFLTMLFLQHCQCKKNDTEPVTTCSAANTVLVPQDMKDRFFFKEGTYWIYKNIATNETDSMWVVLSSIENISVDKDDYGNIKNKCYQVFDIRIISNNHNIPYYNRLGVTFYPKEGLNRNDELFGLRDITPLTDYAANFRIENRNNVYENQMGAYIDFADSILTTSNITYKDILHIYYNQATSTYDYLLDMYYAKNIGLVKFKRRTDNTEWELIRSHINQ